MTGGPGRRLFPIAVENPVVRERDRRRQTDEPGGQQEDERSHPAHSSRAPQRAGCGNSTPLLADGSPEGGERLVHERASGALQLQR
jgi:hypothetical protein